MGEKEGSTIITIPEQHIRSCSGCKYYEHKMRESGMNPLYINNCTHPDSEFKPSLFSGNLMTHQEFKIVETPSWCPYLKTAK